MLELGKPQDAVREWSWCEFREENGAVRVVAVGAAAAAAAAAAVVAVVGEAAVVAVVAAAGLATPTPVHTPSAVPFPVAFVGLFQCLFHDLFPVRCSSPLLVIVDVASLGLTLVAHSQKPKSDGFEWWSANAVAAKNADHEWADLEKAVIRLPHLNARVRLLDLNRMALNIQRVSFHYRGAANTTSNILLSNSCQSQLTRVRTNGWSTQNGG